MPKIFISYAKEDFETASEIFNTLVAQGHSVWMDKKNLLPGENWKTEIKIAIESSEVFIACMSRLSVKKTGFVQAELKYALQVAELIPADKIFIIPVRLDECEVPHDLKKLHWLDYFVPENKTRFFQSINNKIDPQANLQKELVQFFLHNGPEELPEHFRGVNIDLLAAALLIIAKRSDENRTVRSRAVRGLKQYGKLDESTWSEIIPTASTGMFEEWLAAWDAEGDTTVLSADHIRLMFETKRLPKSISGFGRIVRKFIKRGAGYTSAVFLPGKKYPAWSVKYDCLRSIIRLDDKDSMNILASFSTMSYWQARNHAAEYIEKKTDANKLQGDEISIAVNILHQIITDGKSVEKGTAMRKARETFAKLLLRKEAASAYYTAYLDTKCNEKKISAKETQFAIEILNWLLAEDDIKENSMQEKISLLLIKLIAQKDQMKDQADENEQDEN